MIDISSRLALATVGNYPGVTEVIIDHTADQTGLDQLRSIGVTGVIREAIARKKAEFYEKVS